ncbi:13795_t:CDS:2, partial [Funneliformis geosporum]
MELNNDEDNANISDSTQTNSTVGIETSSCNVEIRTSKDVKICEHIINTDGSTGNFWSHLEAHHSILRFEKESNNNPIQTKIDVMFQK